MEAITQRDLKLREMLTSQEYSGISVTRLAGGNFAVIHEQNGSEGMARTDISLAFDPAATQLTVSSLVSLDNIPVQDSSERYTLDAAGNQVNTGTIGESRLLRLEMAQKGLNLFFAAYSLFGQEPIDESKTGGRIKDFMGKNGEKAATAATTLPARNHMGMTQLTIAGIVKFHLQKLGLDS